MKEYELTAIIKKIENLGDKYDPNSYFPIYDQLAICEAIDKATPIKEKSLIPKNEEEQKLNKREVFTGNNNVINNNDSNVNEKWLVLPVLEGLNKWNAETPPGKIAGFLESLFGFGSKSGHWLWIAQHYYPLTIYRVLKQMQKRQKEGWESIKNLPAYFTYKIKNFRRMRRCFYK